MQFYDIFNGDADGICALQQLRLEEPRASVLVTGVKRDIALVERVEPASGDELTVLDVSFKTNARAVMRALERGARCRYFDHHSAGEIPQHPNLRTFIDTAPDVCTSLLVDRYLSGRQRIWAVVAAFGDNLFKSARRAAELLQLGPAEIERLRELGECVNYNAYGETVDDLHYHPADLFETLSHYRDPREFMDDEPVFDVLKNAYRDDLYRVESVKPEMQNGKCAVFVLPDAAWSRRVSGPFSNDLAQRHPGRAHAVLVKKSGGYLVSVRAAQEKPFGADDLCQRFRSGGGRKGAAGINHLPESELSRFVAEFQRQFTS
ncbi:MAG: acetyltransferase [Betaproteobacteria bacterium RIFCSPLOWO2_12_FULL_62_58]|nr:MAG: acetyltransferase [Betaproteobacteria bacterium RIFCSPLOWO2_12_FULL_62_58]